MPKPPLMRHTSHDASPSKAAQRRTHSMTWRNYHGAWPNALAWILLFSCITLMQTLPAAQPVPRPLIKDSAYGRPNIVLIAVEELGYGDLGCYGQTNLPTPAVDQLAAEGMKFTQAYAGSPFPALAQAALLTGKPANAGSAQNPPRLEWATPPLILAEILQRNNYLSCALGKWPLDANKAAPLKRGFDEWFGLFEEGEARQFYPRSLHRNDRTMEINPAAAPTTRLAQDWLTIGATNYFRSTQVFPFFVYRSYAGPPTNAPAATLIPKAAQKWPAAEQVRAAWLAQIDRDLDRMLQALKSLKLEDKTVVIFTGAGGPGTNVINHPTNRLASTGKLRTGAPPLYEGNLRVPLLIRWPNRVKAGSTNDLPVAHGDIAPTLAELADLKPPTDLPGRSLVTTLLGKPATNRQEVLYWEVQQDGLHQAARLGKWKAVRHGKNETMELYDLEKDPGEQHNVAAQEPLQVKEISDFLRALNH